MSTSLTTNHDLKSDESSPIKKALSPKLIRLPMNMLSKKVTKQSSLKRIGSNPIDESSLLLSRRNRDVIDSQDEIDVDTSVDQE